MKKCPFCEHAVGEATILCPNCKKIITEPERTRKQRLKNLILGAFVIIMVSGLAYAFYFVLGVTPVTAFVKGNIDLCSGIASADTALLGRMNNEAFTAEWQIKIKNVRYLAAEETGDFKLDLLLRKSRYDAAFASEYDFNGMQYNRQVSFMKGQNVYFGWPDKQRPATYMQINGNEYMALSDRLPVLFTQFKTKDEFMRVGDSILTLISESIGKQYVHRGKGELQSRITGDILKADTITLSLDREGLKSVFGIMRRKLGETPGAYDNIEKMFGYLAGSRPIRDIIENDMTAEIDAMPEGSDLNWTVYQINNKAVAASFDLVNANGRYRFLLQNEITDGLNSLHMLLDAPASEESEAMHVEFDLELQNKGEYISGKKYGVVMRIDYTKGQDKLLADLKTEAVLSQVSSEEYHTIGNALLKLNKDGREKTFDAGYDFSYTFNEPVALTDSQAFPINAITKGAVKVDPKAFVRSVFESYSSPLLLDSMETGK